MVKWVYRFGGGRAEGGAADVERLGGKGAHLAEMASLGLPVPPGLTIVADACAHYFSHGRSLPADLRAEVMAGLAHMEALTGRGFGAAHRPLLVSVRSGARVSMPGMMDTVLNLGLNDETVAALAEDSGDERFAFDSYRRFIQMYGYVVLGLDHDIFEEILEAERLRLGHESDTDFSASDWRHVVSRYKRLIEEELGETFPQDPHVQLWRAVAAVFASWMNRRAVTYRALHRIPEEWGTAVNIQAMVFGNLGAESATGVAFTRNPATGEKALFGEFLVNAQGEDVVAGIRTPQAITEHSRLSMGAAAAARPSMESLMPKPFAEFAGICALLEAHYGDMQDVEFTIERGTLWMLQTRAAKRTTPAAIRIAVDMVAEGLITRREAVARIEPSSLEQLLHPAVDPKAAHEAIAAGLPASPGAATGEIVFNADDAVEAAQAGRKVILVRAETSPEDIHGMHAAEAVLTTRGGMTSHAAVVARGMGIPCVVGAGTLRVDIRRGLLTGPGLELKKGDVVTIDGASGRVLKGAVAMIQPELSGDFATLMGWADAERRLGVRANADTPADARAARAFGAEGIGLCRTEHMFFGAERIGVMREMILAGDEKGRRAALDRLLPMQRSDFAEIFSIMRGLPVTIRLLDPPLHEFLPRSREEIAEAALAMGVEAADLAERIDAIHEFNPMLGHRGCRLAVSFPEIAEMQARAIFEAAIAVSDEAPVALEILVPLVAWRSEFEHVRAIVERVAQDVARESGVSVPARIGSMIELPAAALRAGEIAASADFLSFGTNDLTQTVLGLSRDDATAFMPAYQRKALLESDPFASLDRDTVGELIRIATQRGRAAAPDLKLGLCGEHGGDPESIRFFHETGLDYVSCSPFRVPIARLAAAHAALVETIPVTPRLS